MDTDPTTSVIDYERRSEHPKRGIASIGIATVLFTWCIVVLKWDDPFQSQGNEKAVRVAFFAGVLGILVAFRDMSKWRNSHFPTIGLVLNLIAICAALMFLPCL